MCRVRKQGASFGQHLLRYQLERARERLAHPGPLAREVAYAVGFNDLSYFTWAFKTPAWGLPERVPGGRKIVLANGRIVLTHLAWLALGFVCRLRSGRSWRSGIGP